MAIIEVDHLRKRYGDTVAVEDVSLNIEEGEIFGIIGPNGAGKTTTVECIAGLREPDGGTISVAGLDPNAAQYAVRRILGVQMQQSALPEKLTVGEAVALYSAFYDSPADSHELLTMLGLDDKRDTRYAKLSGGQQQRLAIVLALIGQPRIAILDELTTGLDPQARRDTWDLIEGVRERGVTIVLVTHFMEEAERLCDRVAVIDAGRVLAVDTPASLTDATSVEQRLQFRPSEPFDEALLVSLPGVHQVSSRDGLITVTGSGDLVGTVISVLARDGILAQRLRVEQVTLEDAFVALIGGEKHE